MPRKRGPSTRSSSSRRKARQTTKYTWKVVPVLYKELLDKSTDEVEEWLLQQDILELQIFDYLGPTRAVVEKYASDFINDGWTNPANIIGAENDACASCGTNFKFLQALFSFNIPVGAIIDSFEVDIKAITGEISEQCTVQVWEHGIGWELLADVDGALHPVCSGFGDASHWHGYKLAPKIDTVAKVNNVKVRFWERTGGGAGDRVAWTTYADAVRCRCLYHTGADVAPRDLWVHYLAFARQVWSKCIRFSGVTYCSEKTSLKNEFVLRGLDPTVLDALINIIDYKCEIVKHRLTILEQLEQILEDLGILHFESHSRFRVYPQDVTLNVQLQAAAVANTFGNWVEIIPLNTVPFPFHVVGLVIEEVSAPTTYFVQLGYNTVVADPPANYEMGERRVRLVTVPIARATELLDIRGQGIPANSRVMGRVKTASGNADTCNISVVLTRHLEVSDMPDLWPQFPW